MKLKFLGTGSSFSLNNFHTNAIITANSGKKLLIDAGTDIRFSTREAGLSWKDIDAFYPIDDFLAAAIGAAVGEYHGGKNPIAYRHRDQHLGTLARFPVPAHLRIPHLRRAP